MKAEMNGQVYEMFFFRTERDDEYGRVSHPLINTHCRINKIVSNGHGNDREEVCVGVAKQAYMDKYDKYLGMKMAFTRAISVFSREDRKQLWSAFKSHFKNHYSFPLSNSEGQKVTVR